MMSDAFVESLDIQVDVDTGAKERFEHVEYYGSISLEYAGETYYNDVTFFYQIVDGVLEHFNNSEDIIFESDMWKTSDGKELESSFFKHVLGNRKLCNALESEISTKAFEVEKRLVDYALEELNR